MSQPPLFYRESGRGNDRTLLLVHGGGVSGRLWEHALGAFGEYHCLAPDLPGHGGSAHIQPFAVDNAVAGLAALIREQAAGGVACVAAVSAGVPVALGLVARHPTLVSQLFLSGPSPRLGKAAAASFEWVARPLLRWMGPERRMRLIARSMGLSEEQVEMLRDDFARIDVNLVGQINAVLAGQDESVLLPVPALVTVGEKEYGVVKSRAREIVLSSPESHVYIVRGAGHGWILERPALFEQVIRAWMEGAALPSGLTPL